MPTSFLNPDPLPQPPKRSSELQVALLLLSITAAPKLGHNLLGHEREPKCKRMVPYQHRDLPQAHEGISSPLFAKILDYWSGGRTGSGAVVENSRSRGSDVAGVGFFAEDLGTYFCGRILGGPGACGAEVMRVCFVDDKPSEGFAGIAAPVGVERA